MTRTDWNPQDQPVEDMDPLSPTGMFLRALDQKPDQPQKQSEASPVESLGGPEAKSAASQTPAEAPQGSSGEFTQFFKTPEPSRSMPQQPQASPTPLPTAEQKQASVPAPGEFTRIFVKPSEPLPAQPARATPETPTTAHSVPGSPRLKGFSTPGASGSASAEGSFTQFFQAPPPAPASTPPPRVPSYAPPTPAPPTPPEEFKWPGESDFGARATPAEPPAASPSATGLFSSLAGSGPRQPNAAAQPAEIFPSFASAPSAESSADEPGSVTRLIQRLSEGVRVPPPAETPQSPPAAANASAPAADAGPGEFTRIISGGAFKAPTAAPPPVDAPPAPAPAFALPVAPPPPAMPPAPMPAVAPPAIQVPHAAPPPVAAPKLAAPAVPAPKTKLEEMVPILLVVNTFLLIVLMVIVIFALKAK
jgi:hypothetical protein